MAAGDDKFATLGDRDDSDLDMRSSQVSAGVPHRSNAKERDGRSLKKRNYRGCQLGIVALLAILVGGDTGWWAHRGPQPATQIFEAITYGCERLETTREGGGLLHWVRIDLTAPGIEVYITSLDPSATVQGWQYRLRRIEDVMEKERLSVAINGALFTWNPGWLPPMSGDLANGVETVVANHVISHVWEDTYLLWFDDHLTPHLRASKPPGAELAVAKWGIGGQAVWLRDGKVWPGADDTTDARTAVAIDQQRKLLFLAVAESISPRRLLQKLADLGAKEGMLLDGGGSSSMAIGKHAEGIPPGVLYGGGRAVATHFGIRAQRLRAPRKS